MEQSQAYSKTLREHSAQNSIAAAQIINIDGKLNTASIKLKAGDNTQTKMIDLPTFCSPSGIGMRFVPFADSNEANSIRVYQEAGECIPLGYKSVNTSLIDERDNTKSAAVMPLRYIVPGEVSIASGYTSELFFSKSGGVHLTDGNYNAIVIDPVMSTINLQAANIKCELDGVRLRLGNVKRPVNPDSYDEMFLIKDGEIQEKEFLVQVGTQVQEDGTDTNLPDVGFMGLGTRVFDEQGRFYKLKDDHAQFLVKTASGGGIGISDKGDIYFMDYKGGNTTVFNGGETGEKWFRVGSNAISISETSGVTLSQAKGSCIELPADGTIALTEANGRGITIDTTGIIINATGANLTLMAKDSTIMGGCSFGTLPMYGVLRAELIATLYSAHTHAGPIGPPVIPWIPLLNTTPAGILSVGLKIS